MAISATSRGSNQVDGSTSVSVDSFTPGDGSLLVAVIQGEYDSSGGGSWSVSGGGLTWTKRVEASQTGAWAMITSIWTAPVVTGASMSVTATMSGGGVEILGIQVLEINGQAASPIGLSGAESGPSRSSAAYSLSLGGTPLSTSIVVGSVAMNTGNWTGGTGWTGLGNVDVTWFKGASQYKGSGPATCDWANLDATYTWAAVAIEIKEASAGGKAFPIFRSRRKIVPMR